MPVKTTREEIAVIKQRLEDHIGAQKEDFKDVKQTLTRIDDKIDRLTERFAGKWVEKIALGTLLATIGAIITFIFTNAK